MAAPAADQCVVVYYMAHVVGGGNTGKPQWPIMCACIVYNWVCGSKALVLVPGIHVCVHCMVLVLVPGIHVCVHCMVLVLVSGIHVCVHCMVLVLVSGRHPGTARCGPVRGGSVATGRGPGTGRAHVQVQRQARYVHGTDARRQVVVLRHQGRHHCTVLGGRGEKNDRV